MMAPKRIVLSITRKMDAFLESKVEETGMDRSNLVRAWIWEQMERERDRQIAERQIRAEMRKKV